MAPALQSSLVGAGATCPRSRLGVKQTLRARGAVGLRGDDVHTAGLALRPPRTPSGTLGGPALCEAQRLGAALSFGSAPRRARSARDARSPLQGAGGPLFRGAYCRHVKLVEWISVSSVWAPAPSFPSLMQSPS